MPKPKLFVIQMKRTLSLLLSLFAVGIAAAQTITIKGKIVGLDDRQPIAGAYVTLNATEADFERRTVLTDVDGAFTINSKMKSPNITIAYVGHKKIYKEIDPKAGKVIDLGTLIMAPEAIEVEAVTVKAQAPMSTMKGDTVQFNATAFKTNPDASSEDLVKKMPGVTTDDDGAVEVQGQKVGKVLVDGKEFFADDPAVALKTMPADVVESIQMFDDKSDESKFSGFDDGERIKTINIVTKNGVSTSTFGKAYAGYGSDDRYSGGVAANIFNTNHRFTIIGQANNVNNQGFTLNDIAQSVGGRGGSGGVDASGFTTSARGGVQTTNMAGLNYHGEFTDKLKLDASYFFNNVSADQWRTRQQNYISIPRDYNESTGSEAYNYNHRFSMRMEWNPNKTNRIFFMPRVTYSTNHGNQWSQSETMMNQALSNTSVNDYTTRLGTYDASANLGWMHRFGKEGRTLSIFGSFGGQNGWGDRTQNSIYGSQNDVADWVTDSLRQIGFLSAPNMSVSGRISYSEPISKSSLLNFSYNIRYNESTSDKRNYNWDKDLQDYNLQVPDTATSNIFDRDQTRHSANLGYRLVKGKVVLSANVAYQLTSLNDSKTLPRVMDQNYIFPAVLPRLRFEFKPTKMQSLTIDYNRSTGVPSVSQLQDVLDITNPLQVFYGNPSLKQTYTDAVNISYNMANPEKSTNLNIYASASTTQDYIAYHRRFLTQDEQIQGITVVKGAQVTTPVNLDGYFRTNIFATYSFKIAPLRSNMSVTGRYGYSTTPSMENNTLYKSRNNTIGMNLSLTSNISEKVDFTVAYRPSVNLTNGTTGSFDRYIRSDLSGFLNVFLWKGFFINADATWRNTTGTKDTYGQHFALLNAGVGYKFLKYQQAEFRLSGYDLLNQNRAFWQSSYDTYTEINTTNILKRYFMLSFTYKFDTRKGRSADNYGAGDKSSRDSGAPARSMGGATRMSGGGGSSMGGGRPH